jgi:hypothetical protein
MLTTTIKVAHYHRFSSLDHIGRLGRVDGFFIGK